MPAETNVSWQLSKLWQGSKSFIPSRRVQQTSTVHWSQSLWRRGREGRDRGGGEGHMVTDKSTELKYTVITPLEHLHNSFLKQQLVSSSARTWMREASRACEGHSKYYFVNRRAGTVGVTPHGTPHSARSRGRGSGGWCPGTWTAQCWSWSPVSCGWGGHMHTNMVKGKPQWLLFLLSLAMNGQQIYIVCLQILINSTVMRSYSYQCNVTK